MQASEAAAQGLSLLASIIPTSQPLHRELKNALLITTPGAADWVKVFFKPAGSGLLLEL